MEELEESKDAPANPAEAVFPWGEDDSTFPTDEAEPWEPRDAEVGVVVAEEEEEDDEEEEDLVTVVADAVAASELALPAPSVA